MEGDRMKNLIHWILIKLGFRKNVTFISYTDSSIAYYENLRCMMQIKDKNFSTEEEIK